MVAKKKIAAGLLTCTVQPLKQSLVPFRLTYERVTDCSGLPICHCCCDMCPCQISRTLYSSHLRPERNYTGRRLGSSMLFFLIRVTDFIDIEALTSCNVNILCQVSFRTDCNIQSRRGLHDIETKRTSKNITPPCSVTENSIHFRQVQPNTLKMHSVPPKAHDTLRALSKYRAFHNVLHDYKHL
jgi:hypothetical protein